MTFTAEQLHEAIKAVIEADETDGWLELTMHVLNPDYEAGAYKAYETQVKAWAAEKGVSKVFDPEVRSRSNELWQASRHKFYDTKSAPLVVTIDGMNYAVKSVDQQGGMDEGTYAHVVIEVDGRTFKKTGSYYSHDGYYWDGDFKEVSRVTKTVEVYE